MRYLRIWTKRPVIAQVDDEDTRYDFELTDECVANIRSSDSDQWETLALVPKVKHDYDEMLEKKFRKLFAESNRSWTKAQLAQKFHLPFDKASEILDNLYRFGFVRYKHYEVCYVGNED